MNDDDLDYRLALLNREAGVSSTVLDSLAVAARQDGQISKRRRLALIGLSAVLVVGGGAVAAPATADVVREFLAQAQWFPAAGGEILPDSEWVDLEAGDLREYIDHVFPEDLPIPPSMTREELVDGSFDINYQENAVTQEVGLRHSIELLAYCGWVVELAAADRDADQGRYDEAAGILLGAADWPAIVATDGGGIADHLRDLGTAAVQGETKVKYDMFDAGGCTYVGFSLSDIQ